MLFHIFVPCFSLVFFLIVVPETHCGETMHVNWKQKLFNIPVIYIILSGQHWTESHTKGNPAVGTFKVL